MSECCCHCCGELITNEDMVTGDTEEVCEKCLSCIGILQFYSWNTDFDDDDYAALDGFPDDAVEHWKRGEKWDGEKWIATATDGGDDATPT